MEPQRRKGRKGFYFFQIGTDDLKKNHALTGKSLLQVIDHSFYTDFFDVFHLFCAFSIIYKVLFQTHKICQVCNSPGLKMPRYTLLNDTKKSWVGGLPLTFVFPQLQLPSFQPKDWHDLTPTGLSDSDAYIHQRRAQPATS